MQMKAKLITLVALTSFNLFANAALFDRGNGLIYDDVLNITWLQDANYASTSGYTSSRDNATTIKSNGRMDWFEANRWADQLSYQGFQNWRLPTLTPVNGNSFTFTVTYDGSTDRTYNLTQSTSELAYMYYINLGNQSVFDSNGNDNPNGSGLNINSSFANGGNNADLVSFNNLKAYLYWYDSLTMEINNGEEYAWGFGTINGMQEMYLHGENPWTPINTFYAWAVHDGDIAASPVPAPAAIWLFSSALISLVVRKAKA